MSRRPDQGALGATETRQAFLFALGERLRSVTDAREVTATAAEAIGSHLGVARAGFGEIDPSGEIVRVTRDWTDGTVPSLAGKARMLDAFGPAAIAELRAGRTLVVDDCLTDPRSSGAAYAESWASIATRALIVVPLIREGALRALLYLHEPAPRPWLPMETDLAADVAERTWDALIRAQAEQRLRESEERLRQITDNLPALIGYVDAEERYRFNNKAYESWIGRTPESLNGLTLRQAVGDAAYERAKPYVEAALRGQRTRHEWWAPFAQGVRFMRSEYVPDRRDDGTIAGFFVLASDLSDYKRAEEARANSEIRLRLAVDAGRMAVWETDSATDSIKTSPELNRLLGFPPDAEPTPDEIRARYDPGARQHLRSLAAEALARGERYAEGELPIVLPDGSRRWLLVRAELWGGTNGIPLRSVGVALDITERKRAEEQIRFQAQLLDSVHEAVIATDLEGSVIYWNRFAEQLYGWSAAEAKGRHVLELTSASDAGQAAATMSHLAEGGSWSGEFIARRRDGSTFQGHAADAPVYDENGTLVGIVGISYDITQSKRAQERQQLLINELNHRVKNTLATVQSIASQTLRHASTLEEARGAFEMRLLALARAHDVLTRENWEGASLHEIASEALEPYRSYGANRFHVSGPEVRLSPRIALALAMALQELATNAVKYGALSNATGELHLSWRLEGAPAAPRLHLTWEESGGPPVRTPTRRGFGSRLIERSLAHDLGGQAIIAFTPNGVVCTVDAPLPPGEGGAA